MLARHERAQSVQLRENSLLQLPQLPAPFFDGLILLRIPRLLVEQQKLVDLVDMAVHLSKEENTSSVGGARESW